MSSLFGSTSSLPQPDQKPLGQDLHRASTNEQATPLAVLYGKQRVGARFVGEPFDIVAESVTRKVGKQRSKVGTNYYASFPVWICHGPADGLHDIHLNGEPVFASQVEIAAQVLTSNGGVATFQTINPHGLESGDEVVIAGANEPDFNGEFTVTVASDRQFQYTVPATTPAGATGTIAARLKLDPILRDETNPDYADFTIPDFCEGTIYWGTEDQMPDEYLQTSGTEYPSWRGICYIVFKRLFFGFNQTSVQNIEVTASRFPDPTGTGSAVIDGEAYASNVAAELWLNHRYGLGRKPATLNTASVATVATQLENDGDLGISPLITRAEAARSIFTKLFEAFDLAPRIDPGGLLEFIALRPNVDPGSLPEITDSDLVEMPAFNPQDWGEVRTETRLKYTNRETAFKEDAPTPWFDQGVFSIIGDPDPLLLENTWITSPATAQRVTDAAGQRAATPEMTVRLRLRMDDTLYAQLLPGNQFTMDYSLRPTPGIVFRVRTRTYEDPALPEFTIEAIADRTSVYALAGDDDDSVDPPPPGDDPVVFTVQPAAYRFIEPPSKLTGGTLAIVPLVSRRDVRDDSFQVYLGSSYEFEQNDEIVDLVPQMTGASTPSGNASASSTFAGGVDPWKAFDKNLVQTWTSNGSAPQWLKYQFPAAVVVNRYSVASTGNNNSPAAWTLEGSNNDADWTVIDAITTSGLGAGIPKNFDVSNTTAYTYYRLNVSSVVSGTRVQIYELGLFGIEDGGSIEVTSFDLLSSHSHFAWAGEFIALYPSDTQTLDLVQGALVQLAGPDLILPAVDEFQAVSGDLLLFAGDEIMAVLGMELIGTGYYKVFLGRGWFGTPIVEHVAGEDAYIAWKSDLLLMEHPSFEPGNTATFKLTYRDASAADSDPFNFAIAGLAFAVPPPIGLAVNSETRFPEFTADTIDLAWELPDPGDVLLSGTNELFIRLEFLIAAAVVFTKDVAWPLKATTVDWSDLSGGGKEDFSVRALMITNTGWNEVAGTTSTELLVKYVAP